MLDYKDQTNLHYCSCLSLIHAARFVSANHAGKHCSLKIWSKSNKTIRQNSTISEGELAVYLLKSINPFFDYKMQRDAHEALISLLDIFSNICNLPLKDNKISTVPEFVDSFFSGIYKTSFICQLCQETNIYYEPFHHITVQPNTDIFSYLAKDFRENKNLTCGKCTTQSCQSLCTSYQETPNILLIQINRFSVSNLHGRPRKNNHPFGIYENIKLHQTK